MGYAGGGVNGALRWKDLALDSLLPIDHEKEEAERAAQARKLASGATSNNNPHQQTSVDDTQGDGDQTLDDEDEEEDEGDSPDDGEEDGEDEDEDMIDNSENLGDSFADD